MKNYLVISAHYLGWLVLGILVSFLLHAFLELPVLWLIISDYVRYGQIWIWQNWELVHTIGTVTLLVLGIAGGLYFGRRDWNKQNI